MLLNKKELLPILDDSTLYVSMVEINSLTVSAPAKVILHGEHSVVYGKVSIATSVDLRTRLTWEKLPNNLVELHLHDLGFSSTWTTNQINDIQLSPNADVDDFKKILGPQSVSDVVHTAARAFIFLYRSIYGKTTSLLPGKFVLKSGIPVGAGLGSSASYCTVLATAMLITSSVFEPAAITEIQSSSDVGKKKRDKCLKIICNWAYEAEKIIHGKPSGIDNTVSAFGGFLQFEAGQMEHIDRHPKLNILLINTNVPRSTKAMVSGLRHRYEELPEVYDHLFNAIGKISIDCRRTLEELAQHLQQATKKNTDGVKEGDYFHRFEKLIDLNQNILRTVNVSHSVIDKVCETTLTYGLHSKLTGAGGGGCVITLLKDIETEMFQKLSNELKNLGCDFWRTKLGGEGVTVDKWTVDENCTSSLLTSKQ